MADLHRALLEQQFSDASILLLMDEYAEADGALLLDKFEKNQQIIPPELDSSCLKKVSQVNRKSEKGTLFRRTVYRASKAAAVFALLLILSVNLILSVEAIRVPILNLYFETQRYFSSLTFSSDTDMPSSPDNDTVDLPIMKPKGYTLFVKDHNHDDYSRIYEDSTLFLGYQDQEGHYYTFQTLPAKGSLSIDTEDAQCTEFLLNGMQAIQIRKESDNLLRTIWVDPQRQRLFDISCDGMREEDFEQHILDMSAMLMAPELYAD